MARRRYISTDISIDKRVNQLAMEYGDFAAMLYTWMIPHALDDATLIGDPDELMYTVIPRRRDITVDDVAEALQGMHSLGLIEWDREGGRITFPKESFYKYQTYINAAKRAAFSAPPQQTPKNTEEHRETPEKAVSPSPSPSPSPKDKEKDIVEPPPDPAPEPKEKIPFAEIVDHLNKVCGTSFKASTKTSRELIRARWGNGFRLDDFKYVIDKKARDWINDPEMSRYLRPLTLFGTKFESYLNEKGGMNGNEPKPTKPTTGRENPQYNYDKFFGSKPAGTDTS